MIDWLPWLLLPALAFSRPNIPPPPPPPPPPGKSDAEIQAEKGAARTAILRRRGRASQILAGEQRTLRPAVTPEGAETLGA